MRKKILYSTQRARKGEGRKARIKPIQVPQEVKEELDIFKLAYSEILGQKVTYEQILRRWMDHAGRIDADVKHRVEDIKETRRRHQEAVAAAAEENALELERRAKANGTSLAEEAMKQRDGVIRKLRGYVAPETVPESVLPEPDTAAKDGGDDVAGEAAKEAATEPQRRWMGKYWFTRGDARLEARISKGNSPYSSFATTIDGKNKGYDFMVKNGWTLVDGQGHVVDEMTAKAIKREHDADHKIKIYYSEVQDVFFRNDVPSFDNPKHSYKFVGPGGEYEAWDGYWGIESSMENEEKTRQMIANEMFEKGYRLVRDDGKEFFSTEIEQVMRNYGSKRMVTAFSLRLFDDL